MNLKKSKKNVTFGSEIKLETPKPDQEQPSNEAQDIQEDQEKE